MSLISYDARYKTRTTLRHIHNTTRLMTLKDDVVHSTTRQNRVGHSSEKINNWLNTAYFFFNFFIWSRRNKAQVRKSLLKAWALLKGEKGTESLIFARGNRIRSQLALKLSSGKTLGTHVALWQVWFELSWRYLTCDT